MERKRTIKSTLIDLQWMRVTLNLMRVMLKLTPYNHPYCSNYICANNPGFSFCGKFAGPKQPTR